MIAQKTMEQMSISVMVFPNIWHNKQPKLEYFMNSHVVETIDNKHVKNSVIMQWKHLAYHKNSWHQSRQTDTLVMSRSNGVCDTTQLMHICICKAAQ